MKDFLIFLPLTVVYLSFKTTIAFSFPLPDITLLIVLFAAQRGTSVWGVVLSFVLGYTEDVFGAAVLGSSSFSLVLIFAIVHLASKRVHFLTAPARAVAAGSLSLVRGILTMMVLGMSGIYVAIFPQIFLNALVTAAFAPVILPAFLWLSAIKVPGAIRGGER